jgi:hypothetical protein
MLVAGLADVLSMVASMFVRWHWAVPLGLAEPLSSRHAVHMH